MSMLVSDKLKVVFTKFPLCLLVSLFFVFLSVLPCIVNLFPLLNCLIICFILVAVVLCVLFHLPLSLNVNYLQLCLVPHQFPLPSLAHYHFCIYCFSFPLPFVMLYKLLCAFWDEFLCFPRSCILRNVWIFWIYPVLAELTACFQFNVCQTASFFRSAKIYVQNTHLYLHFLWALLGGDHKVI